MSPKIKWLAWGAFIILLVYTRFINLSWGLPFPFHPDERNIANAIQGLTCEISNFKFQISNCFNPHFYAYGQLPIYLGYILVVIGRLVTNISGAVRFEEAVLALRFISAMASVGTVFVMLNLFQHLLPQTGSRNKFGMTLVAFVCFIFSPALIQLAHFGTTESLLMLFFTWLILLCLKLDSRRGSKDAYSIYIWIGVVTGLAIATKVSALLFAVIPFIAIVSLPRREGSKSRYQDFWERFNELVFVGFITGATAILFSPHSLISWKEFADSIKYESMVASGEAMVFYTRTFAESVPVLFQFQRIFPYALGWPVFALFLIGFIFLPWKRNFNILRVSFLVYFLPTAFLFTKWTRFMAPILPLMIIIAMAEISNINNQISNKFKDSKILIYMSIAVTIIPGIMFLKVYATPDIRFQASEWMMKNIPEKAHILQETANVVDLPVLRDSSKLQMKEFQNISFDYYRLDEDTKLQRALKEHLEKADYIVIPSRRIFKNHSKKEYPILAKYYEDLFSGKLGFKQVAEFRVFDDEDAEETWTVFDHPMIRIYKRI